MARIAMRKPDESKQGQWTPLPRGSYDVQIKDVVEGTSKNNHPQLHVKGEVVGGPYDGKSTSQFYVLSENSTFRMKYLLDAAGVQYDLEGDDILFDTDDLIGTYVRVDITEREWNGSIQNDWKKVNASALTAQGQGAATVVAPQQTLPTATVPATATRRATAAAPAQAAPQQVAQAAAPAVQRRARA